jgi:hypothetical protein
MEVKDRVRITLTKAGADFPIDRGLRRVRESMEGGRKPKPEERYCYYYHDGQILIGRLSSIFLLFKEYPWESEPPFTELELDDKRVHTRASVISQPSVQRPYS